MSLNFSQLRPCLYLLLSAMLCLSCSNVDSKKDDMFRQAKNFIEHKQYQQAADTLRDLDRMYPDESESFFLLGQISIELNNVKQAAVFFQKALEVDPNRVEANINLAKIYLANRDLGRALTHTELVLSNQPQNAQGRLLKSAILIARGQYVQASDLLEGLIKEKDTRPEVYLLLATAKSKGQNDDGAETILLQGIEKNPDAMNLRLVLARYYTKTKQQDKSLKAYQKLVDLEPENQAFALEFAETYWQDEKVEDARRVINKMIEAKSDSAEHRLAATNFYIAHNDYATAESCLLEGIDALPFDVAMHQGLAEYYLKTSQPDKSVDTLKSYLRSGDQLSADDVSRAKLSLAQIYLQQNELETASDMVQSAISENPDNIQAKYLQGRLCLLKGMGKQAVSAFESVLSQNPKATEAYLQLAEAHVLNKQYDAAATVLQQGLQQAPGYKALQIALARVFLAQKDYKGAEAQFLRAQKTDPADYRLQAELGDFYLALKDTQRAQREYAEIVNKFPDNALGYIKLAALYRSTHDDKAALDQLEHGYRRNPNNAALLTELVKIHLSSGQRENAYALCKRRLDDHPDEAFTLNLLGQLYLEDKRYKEAEESLQNAVDLAPQWVEPSNHLAALYLKQGKTSQAIGKLESALLQNPKNPAAYLTLGRLFEQDEKYQKAIGVYEQALQHVPDSWAAANNLAFLLSEQHPTADSLERAQKLALRAYQLAPGRSSVIDTLGWVYYQKGEYQQALQMYRYIEEQIADQPLVNYHMAMVLLKTKHTDEAKNRLEAALKAKEPFTGRSQAKQALESLKDAS